MIRLRFVLHTIAVLAIVGVSLHYAAADEYRMGGAMILLALVVLFWGDR